MINKHLNILHLFDNTDDAKVNAVSKQRLDNLMIQLEEQNITDYTIIEGFYDNVNTKKAVNKGHKKIVELAKQQGFENVIIAEDDLVFSAKGAYDYFISQIPDDYDLFTALIYHGEVDSNNRILNGMSGTHTLYSVHSRFFDFILSQPDDVHCDRNAGMYAHQFKYYVVNPFCVYQRGGHSYNLKRSMTYEPYLEGKKLFGVY